MKGRLDLTRRSFMRVAGGGVLMVSLRPIAAVAQADGTQSVVVPEVVRPILTEAFGDWQLAPGRITVEMPVIAETGLSVPTTLSVESPMTEADHVDRIMVFGPGNPEYLIADYIIGPRAGLAVISTRLRIARSQIILGAVKMSDGSQWGSTFSMTVTRGACIDDIFLPDLQAIQDRQEARQQAAPE